MKRYLYNYQTVVSFSEPITDHAVVLRCQPMATAFQTIEQEHVVVSPDYWLMAGVDAFGNRILFGGDREPHSVFAYVSTGIVATEDCSSQYLGENLYLFRQPSRLTPLSPEMRRAARVGEGSDSEKARELCRLAHETLMYVPDCTTVDTSAIEVFSSGRGVCQDYAHLMIAFCRANGIAARYVNGFLEGTGRTHAWVEVFDGYCWRGYDPTHDCEQLRGYVKLSHGRDASDCPVIRGMLRGAAAQCAQINVTLQEL